MLITSIDSLTKIIMTSSVFDRKSFFAYCFWMVYSLVVRAQWLVWGREFESRSLHLKPETKLREERGLSGCRKGLKTVPLAQELLSLKPAKQQPAVYVVYFIFNLATKVMNLSNDYVTSSKKCFNY